MYQQTCQQTCEQTWEPRLRFCGGGYNSGFYDWIDSVTGKTIRAWRDPVSLRNDGYTVCFLEGSTCIGGVRRNGPIGKFRVRPGRKREFESNTSSLCSAIARLLDRMYPRTCQCDPCQDGDLCDAHEG